MRLRRALVSFVLISITYLGVLVWLDSRSGIIPIVYQLASAIPLLLCASMLSFSLRYMRWHWLLARADSRTGVVYGFLCYMSGFLFTATPGKVGELLRIRYLARKSVPATKVISAFIYERSLDLLAVLLLSALYISRADVFIFVSGFVLSLVLLLVYLASKPKLLTRIVVYLRTLRAKRLSKLVRSLRDGIVGCKVWMTPLDILVSGVLGLASWATIALGFSYLLHSLEVDTPLSISMSIYPIAMLSGAASMLPGGIGTTEAAIVALLMFYGSALAVATTAAIGIRLTTLWFAIACGLVSVLILETVKMGVTNRLGKAGRHR